ncbi:hypothetical protein FOC27_07245 [Burkholderia multivorans]|uniref:hypothetical protein n=1 Tax=Burkholderia multivorans TaxID=87883 RepID=UPI0012DCF614|nr:hypothetical protein [Burkholderia multivorans]MCA8141194.1 hypothetical protein [Burkholderia multivorans]QGR60030.1 hypothetical protein FOC27_07245 [Burkholderia multivorans]WVN03370.1 hypothetical protein V1241_14475 [Burkholderia multivorans]
MKMNSAKKYLSDNALMLVLTVSVGAYLSWLTRNYQLDDSLIYLRYLRNLFDGAGLTYNAGERFNGLTSPLYSYVLIVANLFVSNLQYATIALSFVFLCAAAIVGSTLLASGKIERTMAALFVVSFNYFYATFGMETSLFLLLTVAALNFYRRDQFAYVGISLGLLFLTRAEGVFLGVVILGDYILRERKIPKIKYFIVPLFLLVANFAFNYYYYGALFPATGNAKIGQGKSGFWGHGLIFLDVHYMKDWFFGGSLSMLWFIAPVGLYGFFAVFRRDRTALLIAAYLLLLGSFYVFLRIPNYHWYYAPFFLFVLLFAGVGAANLLILSFGRARQQPAFIIIFIGMLIATGSFAQRSFKISNFERGSVESYKNIGIWLSQNTAPGAAVAAVEIGTVGWYSHRYIIDILGLTNPYNADYIAKGDVYAWLGKYSPDYILVHDPLWSFEASANCLTGNGAYAQVTTFDFSGYKLLKRTGAPNAASLITQCAHKPVS